MNQTIILASGSPRRKELLNQIGISFTVNPSKKEEKITTNIPSEVVRELSYQKAMDIAEQSSEGSVVIGADTVVAYEGKILGKPKDRTDAQNMLRMLAGNTHSVYTGVTIIKKENNRCLEEIFYKETRVTMARMSEEEIETYVDSKEPMDKAGSYAIQGKCAAFIEKIDGDYYNVVGLPICEVYHRLKKYME
ncbi:MAG: Maf family protein [Lachnospiraceae bacterium]